MVGVLDLIGRYGLPFIFGFYEEEGIPLYNNLVMNSEQR